MAKQLIYTSMSRGLVAGQTGYTIAAQHKGIRERVVEVLQRISGYSFAGEAVTPPIFAHRVLNLGETNYHLLSRTVDAGADYTGRTNYLAHHLVCEEHELDGCGLTPADVLAGFDWLDRFEGDACYLDDDEIVDLGNLERHFRVPARHWAELRNEPGDAALLLDENARERGAVLIAPGPAESAGLLAYFGESLHTLELMEGPRAAWSIGFTSLIQDTDEASYFRWIGASAGSEFLKRTAGRTLIAIEGIGQPVPSGEAADVARTGIAPDRPVEPSGQEPRQLPRRPEEEDTGDKPKKKKEPAESEVPETAREPVSAFAKANWNKNSASKKAPPTLLTIALKTLYVILALVVASTVFSWFRGCGKKAEAGDPAIVQGAGNPAQPDPEEEARKQFDELKGRIDGLETFAANPPPEISQLADALMKAFAIRAELEGMRTPTQELAKRVPLQLERVTKSIADYRAIALNDGTYQGTREKVDELIGSLSASDHRSELSGLIDGLRQISAKLEKTAAPDDLVKSFAALPEEIFLIGPEDRSGEAAAPEDFSTFVYPERLDLENSIFNLDNNSIFIVRSPPIGDLGNWLQEVDKHKMVITERFDLPNEKKWDEILTEDRGIPPAEQPANADSPELKIIQISPEQITLKLSPKIGGEACLAVINDGETSTALLLWDGVELPVRKEVLVAEKDGSFKLDGALADFLKCLRSPDAPEESIALSFHYRMPEAFEAIAWLGQRSLIRKDNLNDGFHGWKIDQSGVIEAKRDARTKLERHSEEEKSKARQGRKQTMVNQIFNLAHFDDPKNPFHSIKPEDWNNLWAFDDATNREKFRNLLDWIYVSFARKVTTKKEVEGDLEALPYREVFDLKNKKESNIWDWDDQSSGKLTFSEGLTRLVDRIRDFPHTSKGQGVTESEKKRLELFASNLELFSPFLSKNEITNVIQFHEDLSKGKHPVGRRIWSRIPERYKPKAKGEKGKPDLTREQASVFMAGLNRALMADPLFEESAFKNVKLSEETRALLKKNRNAPGLAGVPLNRRLLEETFPEFVKKRSGWPRDSWLAQQKFGLLKPVQGAEIMDLLRSPPDEKASALPVESKETLGNLLTFLDRFDQKGQGTPPGRYEVRIHRGDSGTGDTGPTLMSFDIPWKGGKE